MRVALHQLAHSRAGDKGHLVTLSLIPYDAAWYPLVRDQVSPERVREHLADRLVGAVTRYEMPKLSALMFVGCRDARDTVTTSLHIDGHGKTMSSALLEMEIDLADERAFDLGIGAPDSATKRGGGR